MTTTIEFVGNKNVETVLLERIRFDDFHSFDKYLHGCETALEVIFLAHTYVVLSAVEQQLSSRVMNLQPRDKNFLYIKIMYNDMNNMRHLIL